MLHIEQFKKYYKILHGGVEGMGDSEGMDYWGGEVSKNIICIKEIISKFNRHKKATFL